MPPLSIQLPSQHLQLDAQKPLKLNMPKIKFLSPTTKCLLAMFLILVSGISILPFVKSSKLGVILDIFYFLTPIHPHSQILQI